MNPEVIGLIERWPLIKEFNLPPESNVVVIGAYKGLAMEAIDDLYHPARITGYDPQIWAMQEAEQRLRGRDNCALVTVGLWPGSNPETAIPMGEWHTDACSFVNIGPKARDNGLGYAVDADWALGLLEQSKFDLVIMNIEGLEYQLIPYLREKGWLDRIDRLAIQWHWFPELGLTDSKMNEDIEQLSSHYYLAWDERPAWTYHTK